MAAATAPETETVDFAPLDVQLVFHVQAKICGHVGQLEIRADRISVIAREMRLLKQNGLLVEPQAHTNGNGTAPVCPDHHVAMKPSKFGGYHCTVKDGETYCKQHIKA